MHLVRRIALLAFTVTLWTGVCLVCIETMLHAFPYRGSVAGVGVRAQGTLFTRPGLSADTTFGSWEFPNLDGLPFGVHVSPVDVDVLALKRSTTWSNMSGHELRSAFVAKGPVVAAWLIGDVVAGVGIGVVVSMALGMAWRYLHEHGRRPDELRLRVGQLSAVLAVSSAITLYGTVSYNHNWSRHSRLTGTLGTVQLFPAQLEKFYNKQSKLYDVVSAVVGIQARLQQQIDANRTQDTALNIMFISDIHLAAVYPLVHQYVKEFGVDLIVNTGDESEFGTAAEMTPTFVQSVADITARTPMLWLPGNHDSPKVAEIMSRIKGVTVLGTKTEQRNGGYSVTSSKVDAFGLTIAGLPDPRVYGAAGAFGSDRDPDTDPLEKQAADAAASLAGPSTRFDIFASHEQVAIDELAHQLPDRIRQTNAGHVHEQNSAGDLHHAGTLRLVEGSTGAGGLDNIGRQTPPPPIEFTIESVSSSCEFTKLQRFRVADPAAASNPDAASQRGDVTVSTIYLEPQDVAPRRTCGLGQGVGPTMALDATGSADAR